MELARSTYYDEPASQPIEEARLVNASRKSAPNGLRTAIAG